MSDLGKLPVVGVQVGASRQNFLGVINGWVCTWPIDLMPRADYEVWHGALLGGPGGYAICYKDNTPFGVLENGIINEYNPKTAMFVKAGELVTVHFSVVGTITTGPKMVLYMRTPEVGRI